MVDQTTMRRFLLTEDELRRLLINAGLRGADEALYPDASDGADPAIVEHAKHLIERLAQRHPQTVYDQHTPGREPNYSCSRCGIRLESGPKRRGLFGFICRDEMECAARLRAALDPEAGQ